MTTAIIKQDVLNRIAETLIVHFSGTTVGDGGTWSGSGTTSFSGTDHGPFSVEVNINQWEFNKVNYPSINFHPIMTEPMGRDRIHNSGGKQRLWTQFLISVDQQLHGQSVAGVLADELRNYIDTTRFQPSGTGKEVYVDSTQVDIRPEGRVLHYDFTVMWNYHF